MTTEIIYQTAQDIHAVPQERPDVFQLAYVDPIVIDMNKNGVRLISLTDSIAFYKVIPTATEPLRTGWFSPYDALLVYDANGDGVISETNEINFKSYVPNATSDLDGLGAFDSNGDGKISTLDEKWKQFYLWQDFNGNGVQENGELLTTTSQQLLAVNLTKKPGYTDPSGNLVRYTGTAEFVSGPADLADVGFIYNPKEPWRANMDDLLTASPSGGFMTGGAGNDTLQGGSGPDELWGEVGDDRLLGGDGNDELIGNMGNDFLSGGLGNDTLWGGQGNDTLEGNEGDDVLNAYSGNDRIYGGDGNDIINCDAGNDSVLGGAGNDVIYGGTDRDVLMGEDGNDVLNGDAGDDATLGGPGNDIHIVEGSNDFAAENANEGIDTVITSGSYTLQPHIEVLILGIEADLKGTGNDQNNTLYGNQGNNTLDGGKGADTLIGGAGNDTYVVDSPEDVIIEQADGWSSSFSGDYFENGILRNNFFNLYGHKQFTGTQWGIDTILTSVSYTLPANVENMTLTGYAGGTLIGNDLDNLIISTDYDSKFTGGKGNDTLMGGDHNDSYYFSLGDGQDVVEDKAPTLNSMFPIVEKFFFGPGILPSSVVAVREGNDARVSYGTRGDTILVKNWYGTGQIERLIFSDGDSTSPYMLSLFTNHPPIPTQTIADKSIAVQENFRWTLPSGLFRDLENQTITLSVIQQDGSALPAWLTYDSQSQTLQGTTTTTGVVNLRIKAADVQGWSGYLDFKLSVTDAPTTPAPTPPAPTPPAPSNTGAIATEGNDTLTGSSGDDVLLGKGGHDQLNGQAGHDTLIGGMGNDVLEGQDGNDLLIGGQGDAGEWQVSQSTTGELTLRFTPNKPEQAEHTGLTFKGAFTFNTLPVADTRLSFADGSAALRATVSNLYLALSQRLPDLNELNHWVAQGLDATGLAQTLADALLQSLGTGASVSQKFGLLVDRIVGHDLSTPALIQAGVDYVNGGGTWGQVLQLLASHTPARQQHTAANGDIQLTQTSTWTDSGWASDTGADSLQGGAGNDTLVGGGGNDFLNGGDGTDLAVWAGRAQDFTVSIVGTGSDAKVALVNTRLGTTDTLQSIELLSIGGQSLNAAPLQSVDAVRSYLTSHSDNHLEVVLVGLGG